MLAWLGAVVGALARHVGVRVVGAYNTHLVAMGPLARVASPGRACWSGRGGVVGGGALAVTSAQSRGWFLAVAGGGGWVGV